MYYIVKFVKYKCDDGTNEKFIILLKYLINKNGCVIFQWIVCTLFLKKRVLVYNQSDDNYRTCRNYDVLFSKR